MGKFWGDRRWGREKVACCRTKATISLKRVKIEEKLLRTAYGNSPTLFRTVPSLTPYGLPFPKIGGSQRPPKTTIQNFGQMVADTEIICMEGFWELTNVFRMVPSPTSYGLPFPKIGGLQLSYPLLSQDQPSIFTRQSRSLGI